MMKSQIKIGAILGYVNMFVKILVTFLYTPIIIRCLGQQEYGLYSLMISFIAYFSVLDMGFGNSMVRFISRSQAKKEQSNKINGMFLLLYSIISIIAIIVGIIVFINFDHIFSASLTVAELRKAKILFVILLFNVVISFPLSIFDSYALASEKFLFLKIISIFKTLLVPIIGISILLLGLKSISLVSITVGFNVLFHLITMFYCFKKLKMKISLNSKEYDKKLFKEIFVYSFYIFLNIIVDSIFNNTDQVILGAVCGTTAVSIYAVANQIIQTNTLFSTTISGLFFPRVTKILEEKNADKKLSDLFIKISKIQLTIMFLILSGFIVLGKTFIVLWAGQDYVNAYIITILLIGPSIVPLTQNIGISIVQAKNKHQFRSIMYVLIAILNVALSIPLARKFEGIGAALGSALSIILGQIIIMNIYYWRKIGIDIPKYWKNFIKMGMPLAVLTIVGVIVMNKINPTWINLILFALLFISSYVCVCFFISSDEEKKYIKKIISKFRYKVKLGG